MYVRRADQDIQRRGDDSFVLRFARGSLFPELGAERRQVLDEEGLAVVRCQVGFY
jgi:hypothetical protein